MLLLLLKYCFLSVLQFQRLQVLFLQLLVHLGIKDNRRRVTEVVRVRGYEAATQTYVTETVYAA